MIILDFDNTIYEGDSMVDMLLFSLVRHPILVIKSLIKSFIMYIKYKKGLVPFENVKESLLLFLFKIDKREEYIEEFVHRNLHKIKVWYLTRSKKNDIIITASYELWVKPFCDKIGVENLIGTKTDKDGKIVGKNCKGNEKIRRLNRQFGKIFIKDAYSDSESDLPMFEYAKDGYVVEGDNVIPYKVGYEFKNKK